MLGGGVPYDQMSQIFEYSYTTVPNGEDDESGNIFALQGKLAVQQSLGGPMAGLGFGLGTSRVYAKYFGGSLSLMSLYGYGSDIFLKLKNIGTTNLSMKI